MPAAVSIASTVRVPRRIRWGRLAVGGPRRDAVDAHPVDRGLQDHIRYAEHAVSERGGQSDREDFPEDPPCDMEPPERKTHAPGLFHQQPGHEHCADRLRDIRGDSRAKHAHSEHHDEKEIEHDVHHAADDQNVERPLRVADGAENAGPHVVDQREHEPGEEHPGVDERGVHQIGRRPEQTQQGAGERAADGSQYESSGEREGVGRVKRVVHLGGIVRPEELGDDDGRAGGKTHEKGEDEIQNLSG